MLKITLKENKEEKVFFIRHMNNMFSLIKEEESAEDTVYKVPRAWLENPNNIQILQGKTVLSRVENSNASDS